MTDSLLRTESICRYYQRGPHTVKAVDGIDLEIMPGEFLALVGSSGSGKSTLLNILAGLDQPTSGDLLIDNLSIRKMSRRDRAQYRAHRVGMIFQSFNLVPHLTAQQNIELALLFNNTPKKERGEGAAEILSRLGLADRLDHRPADLSGGEQQRVAIARALVKKPDLIFADEPTGNLDQDNSNEIAALLKEQHTAGLTVVMVTHDLNLAQSISQRIVRMDYGHIAGVDEV